MFGNMIFIMVASTCWTRSWAFAPTLPSACTLRSSLGQRRQRRLGCGPESSKWKEETDRALEQAAKLRQEIADLERDLGKKRRKPDVGEVDETPSENESATSPFTLAPTRWLISMDIGREKGTWMPQSWGISGRRLEVDLSVTFLRDGETACKVVSPFIDMKVRPGRWTIGPAEGAPRRQTKNRSGSLNVIADTCRFWVETDGFARGDVTIPPGKVYFAVPVWGSRLFRKGLVTVRQRRWLVREESRILGVFGAEIIETGADGQEEQRVPRPRLPPFPSGFKD